MKRFDELAKVVQEQAEVDEKNAQGFRQRQQLYHDKYDAIVRNALNSLVTALRKPELVSKIKTELCGAYTDGGPYWQIFTPEPRFEVKIYIPLSGTDDGKCFKCSILSIKQSCNLTAQDLENALVSICMMKFEEK